MVLEYFEGLYHSDTIVSMAFLLESDEHNLKQVDDLWTRQTEIIYINNGTHQIPDPSVEYPRKLGNQELTSDDYVVNGDFGIQSFNTFVEYSAFLFFVLLVHLLLEVNFVLESFEEYLVGKYLIFQCAYVLVCLNVRVTPHR